MIFRRLFHSSPIVKKNASLLAFAFDIDGVLLRSSNPIPSASKALNLLKENDIPYILLTNGGGTLESARAKFISDKLQVEIKESDIVQSHTPYKKLVNLYKNHVLVIGPVSVRDVALKYGFKNVVHSSDLVAFNRYIAPFNGYSNELLSEISDFKIVNILKGKESLKEDIKFDSIMVFNDSRDWGSDIQIIIDLLVSDNGKLGTIRDYNSEKPSIPIYFANDDFLYANNYKLNRFGQGGFRSVIRDLYKKMNNGNELNDIVYGKPTKLMYDFALNYLIEKDKKIENKKNIFMVGDNPASDISGANLNGWSSCLVKTGVYKDGDILQDYQKPTIVSEDVYDAVEQVLQSR